MKHFAWFMLALMTAQVTARAQENNWPALKNIQVISPWLATSAQPMGTDFAALRAAGVGTVINLRPLSEQPDSNEAREVEAAGMRYLHLPISGAADITAENAAKLQALLNAVPGKTLLHCASGNRVGALFALMAAARDVPADTALDAGRRAGLKSLEATVRERLNARCQAEQKNC